MKLNIILFLSAFILGMIISHFLFKQTIVNIKTTHDTTYVKVVVKDTILKPVFTETIAKDTSHHFTFIKKDLANEGLAEKIPTKKVLTEQGPASITKADTLKSSKQYKAGINKTYITKNKDTVTVNAEYVSPIPLSSYSYFNIAVNYSYPKIETTKYIIVKSGMNLFGIHLEFHHGIQLGAGYGLIHKQFDLFAGYGIQLNF